MKKHSNLIFTIFSALFIITCLLIMKFHNHGYEPYVRTLPPAQTSTEDRANHADRIDINTATIEELTELPGIGEAIAGRIVDYRDECGGFSDIEEIMQVSGIGEKLFEKIEDMITVR